MAEKISDLSAVTTVAAADVFELEHAGNSRKITGANLKVSLGPTGTPADPIVLDAVQWVALATYPGGALFQTDGAVYDNGASGVGATLTATSNGALLSLVYTSPDYLTDGKLNGAGTTPTVGDRVLYLDAYSDANQGIYVITNVGAAGAKWVLTRATDADDATDGTRDYTVAVAGTVYMARTSRYAFTDSFTSFYGWSLFSSGGVAVGYSAIAGGQSVVLGTYAAAPGFESIAIGPQAHCTGDYSIALGYGAHASGGGVAIGSLVDSTIEDMTVVGGAAGAAVLQAIKTTQTGDFTLALADMGKFCPVNKATAVAVTIPANATVAFPVGCMIVLGQLGVGAVTATAAGGVTIVGTAATATAGNTLILRKIATNTWWSSLVA